MSSHHRSNRRRRVTPEMLARKAARRQELLDAADRAIRRGGPDVSMDEIAAEAATAKPVLYRYFGDKGGLYQALAERYVQQVMTAVRDALAEQEDASPRRRLEAAIDAYLELVESSTDVYRFLMHRAVTERAEAHATVADFIRGLGGELAAVLAEDLRARGMDAHAAEPWARGIVGMVHVAGDWWLEQRTMTRARLVDHLVTLLWTGLRDQEASEEGLEQAT
ncbi:MAG TPA: TetR family transcriptional regulator [Actinomycetota bacterium]|nr:TetR family transcriptional regulator [Actinomycetota bacterium]